MSVCRDGSHDFVGERMVAFLQDLFGERALKTNLILVVTNVRNHRRAMKERKCNNQTLESIIDGSERRCRKLLACSTVSWQLTFTPCR